MKDDNKCKHCGSDRVMHSIIPIEGGSRKKVCTCLSCGFVWSQDFRVNRSEK